MVLDQNAKIVVTEFRQHGIPQITKHANNVN